MSTPVKILLSILVVGMFTVTTLAISIMNIYNGFISMERAVVAQYQQNQNNYDNMWKSFLEASQVTTMYVEDLERVYKGAIEGRYGENGSQAVFQMLREHNPDIDSSLYKRLQEMIESGRNSFSENQKRLIDIKERYVTRLNVFPGHLIANFFNFPRINLDDYNIVTSDETREAFDSGSSGPIQLRP